MDKRAKTMRLIAEEIENLPQGFHNTLSDDFLTLTAVLRLHGFSIVRADEAKEYVNSNDNLWLELQSPSIWIHSLTVAKIRQKLQVNIERHGTPEYIADSNEVITANLAEQRRLLALLEEFYQTHTPSSIYSRLILESVYDQGEALLKPQGASIRIIMDATTQRAWCDASRAEMLAFGDFLAGKL